MLAPRAWADKVYTVQKNDTLSAIAEKHGVSVKELASHNHLSKPDEIKAGQSLKIPSGDSTPKLPDDIQKAVTVAKVKPGRWKYLVIHHSGTSEATAKGMDAYHREKRHMENGLAYHFVIGNGRGMSDGEISIGGRWIAQINGGHLRDEMLNDKALGVCLVGNFDETAPTTKQMNQLHALVAALLKRCDLNHHAVRTHQQIYQQFKFPFTLCPGKKFPITSFLKLLKD